MSQSSSECKAGCATLCVCVLVCMCVCVCLRVCGQVVVTEREEGVTLRFHSLCTYFILFHRNREYSHTDKVVAGQTALPAPVKRIFYVDQAGQEILPVAHIPVTDPGRVVLG